MGRLNQSITVIKVLLVTLLLGLAATSVVAEPRFIVKRDYYDVDATSVAGLKRQMRQRGPKRYWAYTNWYVKWSKSCVVSVKIDYEFPRHKSPQSMSPALRTKWDAMVKALISHEEQHGQFGMRAAREISRSGCVSPYSITRRWAKEDRKLDDRTDHGKNEGVVLE